MGITSPTPPEGEDGVPTPEPPADHQIGIVDVARVAGVSVSTVSQVFSGKRPVSEVTRRRVMEVVETLGYKPNPIARSMRTRRSHTLALIVPDFANPFYAALARGLQDVGAPLGYSTMVSSTDGDPAIEPETIRQMIARHADGIALAAHYDALELLKPAVARGIPAVLLGGHRAVAGIDVLAADDLTAGRLATEYLLGRGHRRIAFITGPEGEGPPAKRVAGYHWALAASGVAFDTELVVRTGFTRADGAAGMARLLDRLVPPDAALCSNDVVAIGAVAAALHRGKAIPGDIAIMGFDDIDIAPLMRPALTTVSIRPRDQGQALARLLIGRVDGTLAPEPQTVLFEPIVVPRESA